MLRTWMSSRTLMGGVVGGVVLLCLILKLFTGRIPPSLPDMVADYEDHFAIDVVMGVEGGAGEGGWRAAACTPYTSTPSFPIRLPKFNASPMEKNIFFLETTCSSALNAKMACAVESVAMHHPDHQVHLALTSNHVGGTDAIIHAIATRHNVHISTLDVDDAIVGTNRLGNWLRGMEWAKGTGLNLQLSLQAISGYIIHLGQSLSTEWAGINLSDALRLGIVCSVGGIYVDLDIWALAPFPSGDSWIGRERWDHLSNGAFRFPKDHWLCKEGIKELTEHFKGDVWGHNGPGVFQRVVKRVCNFQNISDVRQCKDLEILRPHTFYPLPWKQWEKLFVSGGSKSWTWPLNTVGIHLWNKFSHGSPLHPGDGSVVDRASRRNCPKVYDTVKQIRKLRENLQRQHTLNLSLRLGQGL